MRTEVFKTRAEYEEWESKKGNCIFSVYDYDEDPDCYGEFVCDMIEKDFYELSDEKVGLINPECDYFLLKPLTDKQKELLIENHGIRIIILEEDFYLSDEQKALWTDFKRALTAMKEAGVKLIMDNGGKDIYAFNGSKIDNIDTSYYINENKEKELYHQVDFRKNPIAMLDFYVYEDEQLYVKFK